MMFFQSFTYNLLSVGKLTQSQQFSFVFLHDHCFLQDLTQWKMIGMGDIEMDFTSSKLHMVLILLLLIIVCLFLFLLLVLLFIIISGIIEWVIHLKLEWISSSMFYQISLFLLSIMPLLVRYVFWPNRLVFKYF